MYKNLLVLTLLYGFAISSHAQNRPAATPAPNRTAAPTQNRPVTPAPKPKSHIKIIEVSYKLDSVVMKGYVAYDSTSKVKMPAVLIMPEWWGSVEYVKMRARMLAELGYLAMTVDLYGNGAIAKDVAEAQALSAPFYKDPNLAMQRAMAAEREVRSFTTIVDQNKIGMIGYCFGGAMALNCAKLGMHMKAVVSFHGGLNGVPAIKGGCRAKILVCHGAADKSVTEEEVAKFKADMDNAGIKYLFRSYPNATHAFTNPDATATGKKFNMPIEYNAEADARSWRDMQTFLRDVFVSSAGHTGK